MSPFIPQYQTFNGAGRTCEGRLSGLQAAAQITLPIAAAAFGMTAFGIAFLIVEHWGV
jgi:hypothetical protein